MGKLTGRENKEALPEKVLLLYNAIGEMLSEGIDLTAVKVSEITERAGIGKGTAYDYFDSKEEMVARALLFYMESTMEYLEKGVWEQTTFTERVSTVFKRMSEIAEKNSGALRLILMLFDNNQIGILIKEELKHRKEEKSCEPLLMTKKMIEKGIQDGEIKAELPMEYMMYMMTSRVMTYMMYLLKEENGQCADEEFRHCLCQGIIKELSVEDAFHETVPDKTK